MSSGLSERLAAAGMSPAEAGRKAALFEAAARALEALLGERPAQPRRWYVPGRIEVLGKHTDYAGGRSLLCAVERGLCVVASPRSDRLVRIADAVLGAKLRFELSSDLTVRTGDWTVYPLTVARRIARNFPGALRGADIAFASDLPRSAGLSSSSALVVAFFSVLAGANRLEERAEFKSQIRGPHDLAGYLGCCENGYTFGALEGDSGVGTFGGSEDHTAILCCRAGFLSQYAFCPVREERKVSLPPGWTFVVGASGIEADKAGNARDRYNRVSLAAAAVLKLWRGATQRADGTLFAAATHSPDAPEEIRRALRSSEDPQFSAKVLLDRFEQFLEETTRIIPEVGDALARQEMEAIGDLVDGSQRGAERLLGNQIPETVELARSARALGAAAASAFGGGFGGSVWALVPSGHAPEFRAAWEGRYRQRFPEAAGASEFFLSGAGPGLIQV